jgi:hypothetical protein
MEQPKYGKDEGIISPQYIQKAAKYRLLSPYGREQDDGEHETASTRVHHLTDLQHDRSYQPPCIPAGVVQPSRSHPP